MANLDLDIVQKEDLHTRIKKTHTTFKMKWYETVVFHNYDLKDSLVITIQGDKPNSPPVLCNLDGAQTEQTFTVPARESKGFGICRNYQGPHFTYTAQIGPAVVEDPIVIIER